jgi:S-(hydroxymethyl)glutathione dehydrogenase / alcohol dehydrogenase
VDIPRYVDLYLQGRLKLDELVSARIPLEEVSGGLEELHSGAVTRSVVTFG